MCHYECEVLEVFVTIEAAKTLSFAAFCLAGIFKTLVQEQGGILEDG